MERPLSATAPAYRHRIPSETQRPSPAHARCPDVDWPTPGVGVEAYLELDHNGRVTSGSDISGRLILASTTEREFRFVTDNVLPGYVVAPGGSTVLGRSTAAQTRVGRLHVLPPGGHVELPVIVGTTTCGSGGGGGLPAGTYEAYASASEDTPEIPTDEAAVVGARALLTIEP